MIIPVKIKFIKQETPTVRVLNLDLLGQKFSYNAGQWIDCYAEILGKRELVGYSIASSPLNTESIEIAVKNSDNPVTEWVHSEASIGDTLYVEGGQGDVFYSEDMCDKVVLVGAGIGMAPLMGILRYVVDSTKSQVTVVQSASDRDEMIYHDEIMRLSQLHQRVTYVATLTREDNTDFRKGRIDERLLNSLTLDTGSLFFLSGPGGMIPEVKEILQKMGVPEDNIRYEVWW